MINFKEYIKNKYPIMYSKIYERIFDEDKSYFVQKNFVNVDFSGVDLFPSLFINCLFEKCNFDGLTLNKVIFDRCWFHDMQVKNITGTYIFTNCNSENFVYDYACPKTGSFTGYKKVTIPQGDLVPDREMVLTLQIPEDALRSSTLGSSKCRANKVKVLSAVEIFPNSFYGRQFAMQPRYRVAKIKDDSDEVFHSITRDRFTYKIGEEYEVDNFDKEQLHECAPGIHFFMDMNEAATYGWDY